MNLADITAMRQSHERIAFHEFVILLLPDGFADDWSTAALRLIGATADPLVLPNGQSVRVGKSVGLALCPRDGNDPTTLLTKADQALLVAKRSGKGQVRDASSVSGKA